MRDDGLLYLVEVERSDLFVGSSTKLTSVRQQRSAMPSSRMPTSFYSTIATDGASPADTT
ncbi:hypothetical protein ACFQH8_12845 [Halomicroarcula sp. GCM10025710]